MDYTTIDEKNNIILGYDVTGKEYFVWDKTNSKWQWFKSLSQAKNYFDAINYYVNKGLIKHV